MRNIKFHLFWYIYIYGRINATNKKQCINLNNKYIRFIVKFRKNLFNNNNIFESRK